MWLEAPTSPRSSRGSMRIALWSCRYAATSAPDTNSLGRQILGFHPESTACSESAAADRRAADEGTAFCNKAGENADSWSPLIPRNDRLCVYQQSAKSPGMNTYAKSPCNPRIINTYKI